jgi:hypothetical protein
MYSCPEPSSCEEKVLVLSLFGSGRLLCQARMLAICLTSKLLCPFDEVQCVPLATELSISVLILTQMKILQRNLNRSTFVL